MDSQKLNLLIESVIEDLANNEGLSKVLMKVQVIAHHLKNIAFSTWLSNEMNGGYSTKETLPEYRIGNCEVFCNVSNRNGMLTNVKVATGSFSNTNIKEITTTVLFYEPILEIEGLATSKSSLKKHLSSEFLYFVDQTLNPGWHASDVWQVFTNFSCKSVVDTFKSKLLQFFLELNEQFETKVNFNVMANKKIIDKILGDTIYAGIVTTGQNSSFTVNNSQVVGGQNNYPTFTSTTRSEIERELKTIEDSLEIFGESQDEIRSEINRIKVQITKEKPRIDILKNSIELIKSIFIEVVATGTAPMVLEGINQISSLIVGAT